MSFKGRKIIENLPEWQIKFFCYSTYFCKNLEQYLFKQNISIEELSKKIDLSDYKIKEMLTGHYDFNIKEITKLELLFSGYYDIYKKELLIEKI